jgi:hypothetical protein
MIGKYASALPYTDAERDRDEALRHKAQEIVHNRRKALKSKQNYNVPGDKASKARDLRTVGEREALDE